MPRAVSLDTELLRLSGADRFTLRDALQGVSVLGGIGSGKTSGSGRALALAYLKGGMGGLVLCAKPEEATLWRQYLAAAGRADSLIEFSDRRQCFNFLTYELGRQGEAGLNSVVECLMRVLEAARSASPSPGRGNESFWEQARVRQFDSDPAPKFLRSALPAVSHADFILPGCSVWRGDLRR